MRRMIQPAIARAVREGRKDPTAQEICDSAVEWITFRAATELGDESLDFRHRSEIAAAVIIKSFMDRSPGSVILRNGQFENMQTELALAGVVMDRNEAGSIDLTFDQTE